MSIDAKAVGGILEAQLDLLVRKNADYSSDNLRVDGLRGVAVRLVDKVARLRNLLSKPEEERQFESILDTLRDISNYGVIGQLLESGDWGRDFDSVAILAERESTDPGTVQFMEDCLRASRIPFSWACDIWRSSNTDLPWSRSRRVTEALLEVCSVAVVVGSPTPEVWRLVEWYRARGGRVVVVTPNTTSRFDDFETFDRVEEALSYIIEAGMSNNGE